MATETASQTARYTFTEDGTLTVTGRGQCIVKVVGNTWGGGTMSLLDDVCVADEFKAVDIDGTAITLNTGSRGPITSRAITRLIAFSCGCL